MPESGIFPAMYMYEAMKTMICVLHTFVHVPCQCLAHSVFTCLCSSGDIKLRCGPDAVTYLALERYLIVLLCVFTVLSILIVLPVNYLAGHLGEFNYRVAGLVHMHFLHNYSYPCSVSVHVYGAFM